MTTAHTFKDARAHRQVHVPHDRLIRGCLNIPVKENTEQTCKSVSVHASRPVNEHIDIMIVKIIIVSVFHKPPCEKTHHYHKLLSLIIGVNSQDAFDRAHHDHLYHDHQCSFTSRLVKKHTINIIIILIIGVLSQAAFDGWHHYHSYHDHQCSFTGRLVKEHAIGASVHVGRFVAENNLN